MALILLVAVGCAGATPHPYYEGFSAAEPGFTINDEVQIADDAVYEQAWYSINETDWQPLTLTGTPYGQNDSWLRGTSTAALPPGLRGPGLHYVIAYTCTYEQDWDCHGGQWQLRTINNSLNNTLDNLDQGFLRTFYVSNDGDDANDGTTPSTPWKTIAQVNEQAFLPGDAVLFRRGDTFIGSLTPPSSGNATHYITFGAYSAGERPIITPNDYVEGLTWTAHGNGIYKTTDIPFNPGNVLIDGTTKINKINDKFFATPSPYLNYTSLDFLALPDDHKWDDDHYISPYCLDTQFWDGLDALYAYDNMTGTTYIRFRGGDDPNDYSFAISPQDRFYAAVTINRMNHLVIQNLHIVGGERGVYVLGSKSESNENIIIENNLIESSNGKIYLSSSEAIIVRNNTFRNNYLSPYKPGAWSKGNTYEDGVQFQYYLFFKVVVTPSSSCSADGAVVMSGGYSDNSAFYNNTVSGLCCGFSTYGDNISIHDNYIEGTSSIGVYLGMRGTSYVHDNYIVDSNIPFRFGSVDRTTFDNRVHYVYRNKVYIPDAGEVIYIHYDNTGPSVTKAYIYHNSFITRTGPQISGYVKNYPPYGSGFVFINNIISASQTAFYTWSTSGEYDDLFTVDYNWISGRYYGKESVPWAPVPNNIAYPDGPTFWDHAINPPDFTAIEGTEAIDAGIDVSHDFVLGGVTYPALPGMDAYYCKSPPDMGAVQHCP
ncbi:right-handed parallel beta-helix repeat-containing protein [Candidatus Woesearchaeota archaeon]|nr:right-handed parallel beta-helix repeat-containing protein [Candidatus Woesearchaeota archaeon]